MTENNKDLKWGNVNELPFYWIEHKAITEKKETILFLHGFPDDAYAWSHQIEHFQDNYNILAPFMWGTYKPFSYKAKHYSLSFLTETYSKFIKEQEVETDCLTIVAHDLGGPLACELARYLKVKKLILINSLSLTQFIGRFKDIEQWLRSSYMFLFQNPLINKTTLSPFSSKLLNKSYDIGGLAPDDIMRKNSSNVFSGIEQYRQFLREVPKYLLKKLPPHEVSTHILWGKSDPFLTLPTNQELCEHYKRFEFHKFSGSHWVHRSHAIEINKYIEEVLSE